MAKIYNKVEEEVNAAVRALEMTLCVSTAAILSKMRSDGALVILGVFAEGDAGESAVEEVAIELR